MSENKARLSVAAFASSFASSVVNEASLEAKFGSYFRCAVV
jgi:hypothetical protein